MLVLEPRIANIPSADTQMVGDDTEHLPGGHLLFADFEYEMLPLAAKGVERDLLDGKVSRRGIKDKFIGDIERVDRFHGV